MGLAWLLDFLRECDDCHIDSLALHWYADAQYFRPYFTDAFAKLADPSKGIINVDWDFVPCGITSPIQLKNKSGTSKFWFSMQVMNANVAVE